MKALISPTEIVIDCNGNIGKRIAQVEYLSFEVAPPLFWTDCPDECLADVWYYFEGQCISLPTETI